MAESIFPREPQTYVEHEEHIQGGKYGALIALRIDNMTMEAITCLRRIHFAVNLDEGGTAEEKIERVRHVLDYARRSTMRGHW